MPHQPYYDSTGKRLPSVTTILGVESGWNKQILINWYYREMKAGRDPKEKKEKAADTGTLTHATIESYETGIPIDTELLATAKTSDLLIADQALTYYKELKEQEDIVINKERVEMALVSEKYKFGGCIDMHGMVKGVPAIIDTKTSNSIYGEHVVQLGAYSLALAENEVKTLDHYFLKVSKELPEDPKPEDIVKLIKVPNEVIPVAQKIFIMYRNIYEMKKQLDFDYPGKKVYKKGKK